MKSILKIQNLTVCHNEREVLSNISFSVEKGDFVGICGPNGSGKSTLIKTIIGLIPKKTGSVILFGKNTDEKTVFSKIGYLPQKHSSINPLFPASVFEVVSLGLMGSKKYPRTITKADHEKIDEMLKTFKIENLKNRPIGELSGGQEQRVLLARALVSRPELLILDEPSTALDPDARALFFETVKKINKEKKITILLVTHDTGYVGEFANKLLYIDRTLVYYGTIDEFCASKDKKTCFEKTDKHIIWHQHT